MAALHYFGGCSNFNCRSIPLMLKHSLMKKLNPYLHIIEKGWSRVESTIGGLKFAVLLIVLFSLFMVVGTFLESYHGADFAGRVIYKKWPFIGLQILMFLSICFAVFLRMPPRKNLYGFYTIHSGLVIIAMGATLTYIAGIDGNILLHPNEPTRRIILNSDILRLTFPQEGRQVTRQLPYTAFSYRMNDSYEGIRFKKYLPFSKNQIDWKKSLRTPGSDEDALAGGHHSAHYQIFNEQTSESLILSLHPDAIDFESSQEMGPLTSYLLPRNLAPCFHSDNHQQKDEILVIWDSYNQQCYIPDAEQLDIQTTSNGSRFFVIPFHRELLTFFPDYSPWPVDQNFEVVENSRLRLFNLNLFEQGAHLFLFGEDLAYFDQGLQQWQQLSFEQHQFVELPWMDFQLQLLNYHRDQYPVIQPQYTRPIHQQGAIVQGNQQALLIEVEGLQYWVTDERPLTLFIRGREVLIEVGKKSLNLPFEIVLTRFHMDHNPGTSSAASYESFVRLFTSEGPKEAHIYMNNPLKYRGFTFYQASYSQNADGSYSSTLSANVDQGRPLKYFGSLLVVLGSMWHYRLNKKRKFKKWRGKHS